MSENKIIYKHCRNCTYCVGTRQYCMHGDAEYHCSIKHTDCDYLGRIRALLCKFFKCV